ncbi:MAG: ABC transporter ATP-binding protein [Lachnospiraceae bacterium]|nr:ABC transporter ATP-binding protein [Lachnospiraceae bacterium]
MIELKQIVKHYGKGDNVTEALKGVSLKIEKGEFVAITGHSGCGKSTMLNILGGMDRQTEGEYLYDGTDVSRMSEKELAGFRNRHIGFVFQAFHLAGELTALENVALPLGYAGVGAKERKERAMGLLDKVGLSEKYKAHPAKLSGGEMQRVAIARAMANYPQVLLADEPTGNLDRENGEMVMKILRELNKEGMTIIMVTHDLELAAMADRRIRMADGDIIVQEEA